MKTIIYCLLVAGVVVATGCSSTSTQTNVGPARQGTFSFAPSPSPLPQFAEKSAHVQSLVQNAITATLEHKNLTRVARSGNVLVACVVVVDDNVPAATVDEYLGNTQAVSAANPIGAYGSGTLVVQIVDVRTNKLLYRGAVSRRFLRNAPDDLRADRIQSVVDQALAGFHTVE